MIETRSYQELFRDLAEIDHDTFGHLIGGTYFSTAKQVGPGFCLEGFYRLIQQPDSRITGLMAETYGDDTRLYVQCPSVIAREATESLLAERGWVVHTDYLRGKAVMEISVGYEKFDGWDE